MIYDSRSFSSKPLKIQKITFRLFKKLAFVLYGGGFLFYIYFKGVKNEFFRGLFSIFRVVSVDTFISLCYNKTDNKKWGNI